MNSGADMAGMRLLLACVAACSLARCTQPPIGADGLGGATCGWGRWPARGIGSDPGCMTVHNGLELVLRGGGAQLECSPMNEEGSTPAGGRACVTASALFHDAAGSSAGKAADQRCMTLRGGGRGVGDNKINNIPRWDWAGPGDTSQDHKLRRGSKARACLHQGLFGGRHLFS